MLVSDAHISTDGTYRYSLHRAWGDGPMVTWVMLNPSTADASQDDPTIRRCMGFTKSWGYNRMHVVNLYAYRATDPKELLTVADPVGPENLAIVRNVIRNSELVVAAWGAFAVRVAWERSRPSVESFCRDASVPLRCLGKTKDGAPRHPLYVRGDTPLFPFGVYETAISGIRREMMHLSRDFYENDEGWWVPACECGWAWAPVPDAETAVDALMDHARERALIEESGEK